MRRARRTDLNQKAIVQALRDAGVIVEVMSDVGRGFPDLVAHTRGRVVFLEVKRPGHLKLTPDEAAWHQRWREHVHVVTTPQEAIAVVTG